MTVEGDLVSRAELFDEADLDAAIAKFEQLSRPAPRLENAASQIGERFVAYFAAGDWDAMATILADDFSNDDRRRVVGAGVTHGRDAQMANMRTIAEIFGSTNVTTNSRRSAGEPRTRASYLLGSRRRTRRISRRDATASSRSTLDEQIASVILFDLDDFEAAIAELDARYLAGEAAPIAHTWSVIAAATPRSTGTRLPLTTPDCVNIDHRRETSVRARRPDRILGAGWDLGPRLQGLRRGRAPAEQPRSGRHSRGICDLARGLRRRVARIALLTIRRRHWSAAPRYSTRQTWTPRSRGSISSAGRHRGWKTRPAKRLTASWRTSRRAIGTPWRRSWPTTCLMTIAVGW